MSGLRVVSPARRRRLNLPRRRGLVAVVAVLLAGLILSAVAGIALRGEMGNDARRSFRGTAQNLAGTLGTLVGRDVDFVSTLRTVATMRPQLDSPQFRAWYSDLGSQQQVGGIGSGVVRLFRGHGGSWTCHVTADSLAGQLNATAQTLISSDWCDPHGALGAFQAQSFLASAATGQLVVLPVSVAWLHTTLFEMPFYRRGVPLDTAIERDAAVQGWIVSSFDTPTIVRQAIGTNSGLAVSLRFTNLVGGSVAVATVGAARGSMVVHQPVSAGGPWTVVLRGAPGGHGVSAAEAGLLVFAGGVVVSLLVSLLILTLSRSRRRALQMVHEKTTQLRHQALHDALTGLPNRVLAVDRGEQMLARARRAQMPMAVLYIDVDGFKHINDTFGHGVGDDFLCAVADRLRGVIREGDTAARLAGDEFVVLLEAATLDAGPELVAERVLEVLREPFDLGDEVGRELRISSSIGVAYGQTGSMEQLLADADVALYAAKEGGRNRFVVFESGMQTLAQDRVALEMDLTDALAGEQLFLVYQPTFDLRSEEPTGAEALLRWRHPDRGLIGPDVFIPIAEASGLILPIGRWVLLEACRQAAQWHAAGHHLGIAVNVSRRQLDEDALVQDVQDALAESGVEPGLLTLEITETALMQDAGGAARRLSALKELGVQLAIDDFGTGYSSLAYLREFPVDTLKIDRSFVDGIATSRESTALMQTLIDLGKTLNLETLAEGIEEREQLQNLQRVSCDSGQGFLLSRPLDAEAFAEFLGSHSSPVADTVS